MGCCETHQRRFEFLELKPLFDKKSDREFQRQIEHFLNRSDASSSADSEIKIGDKSFLPLAYTVLHNLPSKFRILHQKFHADLGMMEDFFRRKGTSGLEIICEKGYIGILEYYLPYYLSEVRDRSYSLIFTIEFDRTPEESRSRSLTPVQQACLNKQYAILSYLIEYFRDTTPPPELDINFQDEWNAENCASIAVKLSEVSLARYLYENSADFNVINRRGESLLQVAAIWSKRRKHEDYFPMFRFLVERAGVDLTYNYEEILLVLQDSRIISYYEERLRRKGINENKNAVELKGLILPAPPRVHTDSILEEILTTRFNKETFPKESHTSLLSSINETFNHDTPFITMLNLDDE